MLTPDRDCTLCPRLVAYRLYNQKVMNDWHNAPALPFGDPDARLLIVGLAPGRTGANRTGRVFTGDSAGRLLFETLIATGYASGEYCDNGRDNVSLHDCMITNALLCAPPGNKPTSTEEATCRPHLTKLIQTMPKLRVIVTLGDIARRNVLRALGHSTSAMSTGHAAKAIVGSLTLINSYHCSRLNLNTGRLTRDMFMAVFHQAREAYSPSQ